MTKSFNDVNRRGIIKGAAWAAPVVAATATIPAYAASNSTDPNIKYTPYVTQSQSMDTGTDYSTYPYSYYTTVETSTAVGRERPGFLIGLTADSSPTAATLTSLDYYIALPAGLATGAVTNLSSQVGGQWTDPELVSMSTLPDGTNVSGYKVYKMTFTGTMTQDLAIDGVADTWPGTKVMLEFESGTAATRSQPYIGGYVASFVLAATGKAYNNVPTISEKQYSKVKRRG